LFILKLCTPPYIHIKQLLIPFTNGFYVRQSKKIHKCKKRLFALVAMVLVRWSLKSQARRPRLLKVAAPVEIKIDGIQNDCSGSV